MRILEEDPFISWVMPSARLGWTAWVAADTSPPCPPETVLLQEWPSGVAGGLS